MWVGNKEVEKGRNASFDARLYALVPLSSLNCTIATIFRTGWLSLVPQGTALKIFRDYKLFGQLSPGTLLGRSK